MRQLKNGCLPVFRRGGKGLKRDSAFPLKSGDSQNTEQGFTKSPYLHRMEYPRGLWRGKPPAGGATERIVVAMRGNFGVAGGDQRQLYLARSLMADGCSVRVSCLEEGSGGLPQTDLAQLAAESQYILLPLPATRDGRTLNAPLSRREIPLDDGFARLFSGKTVLGGMLGPLTASSDLWRAADCHDYYAREELVAGNACLTAEGAIGLAIQEYKGALGGARCLVTGYGRIGRALCGMLRGMGAQVDCAARKAKDLTLIRASGCRAVAYQELGDRYELIFNTVPARVLGQRVLAAQSPEGLILELASPPGGVDLEAAGRLGLRVLPAPSLPGKLSPKASGELIKEAVYNILEEQRGGLWARP